MEMTGNPLAFRSLRRSSRCRLISFNSLFSLAIRSLTRRRLISNLVSPGPLPPIPPVNLDMAVFLVASLGSRYLNWASSTWILPSLVTALLANISRMSWLRSMIFNSVSSVKLFTCAGVNSLSKIKRLEPVWRHLRTSSLSFPFPIRWRGFAFFICWTTTSATSKLLETARSCNSSKDSRAFQVGPAVTPTNTALSLFSNVWLPSVLASSSSRDSIKSWKSTFNCPESGTLFTFQPWPRLFFGKIWA